LRLPDKRGPVGLSWNPIRNLETKVVFRFSPPMSGNRTRGASQRCRPTEQKRQLRNGFFIALITRDITLEDAILDLVDNSVNSALRNVGFDSTRVGALIAGTAADPEKVGEIDIHLNDRKFEIRDTCGGIDIETARRGDLFGFGRDDEDEISGDILSVYGIGLKRAMFRLGQHIVVKSHHNNKAFEVEIPVNEWAGRKNEWFFPLREIDSAEAGIQNGTSITVTDLYPQIIEKTRLTLSNDDLKEKIAQTYSLFADKIVKIRLNKQAIPGFPVSVTDAAEIDDFRVDGCDVRIIATLMPGENDGAGWRAENAGWFLLCNGRTVVAADKTTRTGWGGRMPTSVSKFRAFRGIVNFLAENPEVLPWTTTKTDINQESAVYQTTLPRMASTARPVLAYLNSLYSTNEVEADNARAAATTLASRPLSELLSRPTMSFRPPVAP
jgi:hypothetical protein